MYGHNSKNQESMRSFESKAEELLLSVLPRGSVRLSLPCALPLEPLETPLSKVLPLYLTFSEDC